MKTTCNTGYTIDEYWDTLGVITADSDPETEFKIWQSCTDWNGDEFTLGDFEKYIEQLKGNEVSK